MAKKPQDYVTPSGRQTTNAVEGFHGLSLMYRDKRTDLGHTHYVCKSNMGICHKVHYLEKHVPAVITALCLLRTLGQSGRLSAVLQWAYPFLTLLWMLF